MINKNCTVEFIMPKLVGPTGLPGILGPRGMNINSIRKLKIKKILDRI